MRKTKLLALMLAAVMFGGIILASCAGGDCGGIFGGGSTYSVTFDANGGSGAPAKLTGVAKGSTIDEPDASGMTKEGFGFNDKWYRDKEAAVEWNFQSDTVISNLTLYAGWIDQRFNITLIGDGQGTVTGEGKFAKGKAATVTATPDEGWFFGGWYENGALKSYDESYTFNIAADITLKAVFIQEIDDVDEFDNIVLQLNRAYTITEYTTFAFTAEVAGYYVFYTYDETPRGEIMPWIAIYQTSDFNDCVCANFNYRTDCMYEMAADETVYIIVSAVDGFVDGDSYKFVARYLGVDNPNNIYQDVKDYPSKAAEAFDNAAAMAVGKEYDYAVGGCSFFKISVPADGVYTIYTVNGGQAYPYFQLNEYYSSGISYKDYAGRDRTLWDCSAEYVLYKGTDYLLAARDDVFSGNFRIGLKAYTPDVSNAAAMKANEAVTEKTVFSFTPETSGLYVFDAYGSGGTLYLIFFDGDMDFMGWRDGSIQVYLIAGKTYYIDVRDNTDFADNYTLTRNFKTAVDKLSEGVAEKVTAPAHFVFFPETDGWYTFKTVDRDGGCDAPYVALFNACREIIEECESGEVVIVAELKAGKAYLLDANTCYFGGGWYFLKAEKADADLNKFINFVNGLAEKDNFAIEIAFDNGRFMTLEFAANGFCNKWGDGDDIYEWSYLLNEGGDCFEYNYNGDIDVFYKVGGFDEYEFKSRMNEKRDGLWETLMSLYSAAAGAFDAAYEGGGLTATLDVKGTEGTLIITVGGVILAAPTNAVDPS